MFCTFDGCVSLTSDMWTSSFMEPLVCVIVHWIDNDWFLQKHIICFDAMEEAHNRYIIETCFFFILSNATTNTRMLCPNYELVYSTSLDTPTWWNSTYKLLNDAIRYHDVMIKLYNESRSDSNSSIIYEHWAFAMVIRDFVATFDNGLTFSLLFMSQIFIRPLRVMTLLSLASINILARNKAK
ncbi:putative AC transposase, partial [Bienertia sinuspersici]